MFIQNLKFKKIVAENFRVNKERIQKNVSKNTNLDKILDAIRNGLRVVFHHKKKYEKYDISKYEIFFTTQKKL